MGGASAGTFYDRKVAGAAACPVPDPDDPGWSGGWGSGLSSPIGLLQNGHQAR